MEFNAFKEQTLGFIKNYQSQAIKIEHDYVQAEKSIKTYYLIDQPHYYARITDDKDSYYITLTVKFNTVAFEFSFTRTDLDMYHDQIKRKVNDLFDKMEMQTEK